MIHYNVTFERITPESAEYGDAEERGFEEQGAIADFADMLDILYATEPSEYPLPEMPTSHLWFTRYGEADFRTGETVNLSYHPATERDARYMLKAWISSNRRTY